LEDRFSRLDEVLSTIKNKKKWTAT
jgi:hypothetical protein